MLQDVFILFSRVYELFQLEFYIYGYPLSFWDIFIWTTLVAIIGRIIWGFLYD